MGFRNPVGPLHIDPTTRIYTDTAGNLVLQSNTKGIFLSAPNVTDGDIGFFAGDDLNLTAVDIADITAPIIRLNGRVFYAAVGDTRTVVSNGAGDITVTLPVPPTGPFGSAPRSFVVTYYAALPYVAAIQNISTTAVRFRTFLSTTAGVQASVSLQFCWLAIYENA